MKNILIGLTLLITVQTKAQHLKSSDLNGETRPKGTFQFYTTADDVTYKVGDTLKLGYPSQDQKTFQHITQMTFMGQILPVQSAWSGRNVIIKNIRTVGIQKTGFTVSVQSSGLAGVDNLFIGLDAALETGEIVSNKMTSDKAIQELQKAKQKLDLELITQEEYDKIKEEYSKYIK
jgi:hypothetical protein